MLLLISLVLGAVLAVGGLAYGVLRAIAFWRTFKRVGGAFGQTLGRIADAGAQIEGQVQRAQAAAARLQEATGRLQRSRARLDVQVAAVSGAVTQVKRLLWFVPGV
jgi:hypothetical protein